MNPKTTICLLLCLTACTSNGAVPINPLVAPPWETFVRAGPGAENDIDLETLNGPSSLPPQPGELAPPQDTDVATAEPPPEPESPPANPNAVAIKSVAVIPVEGASTATNRELTKAMREELRKAGWPVLDKASSDSLTIAGRVEIGDVKGGSQKVTIVWDVKTPQGHSLGDLRQDNSVPAGSLDSGMGENAGYAAQAAAEGIFELIEKYR